VLVFIVAFLNNLGVPLPGETILLGPDLFWEKLRIRCGNPWWPERWLLSGRRRCLLAGAAAGQGSLEKIHGSISRQKAEVARTIFQKRHGAKTVFIARFIFLVSTRRANLLAGMSKMQWRNFFSFTTSRGRRPMSTTYILIGYFSGRSGKLFEALAGAHGALPDSRGAGHCGSRRDFQKPSIRVFGRAFFPKDVSKIGACSRLPFFSLASEERTGVEFSENIRVLNP